MLRVSSVVSRTHEATAYPCFGPQVRALRMRRSSVPWRRSRSALATGASQEVLREAWHADRNCATPLNSSGKRRPVPLLDEALQIRQHLDPAPLFAAGDHRHEQPGDEAMGLEVARRFDPSAAALGAEDEVE